jgi:hypothetical protein
MLNRFLVLLFITCLMSSNAPAMNDNPFAKTESMQVGTEIKWAMDKEAVLAIKSASDDEGTFYHLRFDNKQLAIFITTDKSGLQPKQFSQLEIPDILIDGRHSALFRWCLNNQEDHNRFLQQGLTVKNNICKVDGDAGSFVMQLNIDTLTALRNGAELLIVLKPYRTPLELHYDLSDFNDMYVALNTRPKPAVAPLVTTRAVAVNPVKICWAEPPSNYKNIMPVEYDCNNALGKIEAETRLSKLIDQEIAKQQKIAAEKEKQHKLAEQKKQQELLKAEAAAIAASEAKRTQISQEITQKMLAICDKYWQKGEHRCYCQKYIEHAPKNIQANTSCN